MLVRRPRIGITSSGGELAGSEPYANAVERAGGEPVALANDAAGVAAALASVDGVVVGGGVDVEPVRYGGNPKHSRSPKDGYRRDRDAFELALIPLLLERGVPTLCICRGLQILNVACGGTLVEDLRDDFGERYRIEHRQTDAQGVERSDYADGHTVAIAPGSAFARLVGGVSLPTNSMHHQAVRSVGNGLVAVGHTTDGVVEVLDVTMAHPFFHAVQWHPEELDDAASAALFGGLISAASETAP